MKAAKLSIVCMALACAGCMETATLVTLNKDGSGTISIREFYSPQITGMMSGMGDMMQGMGEAMGEALGAMGGTTDSQPAAAVPAFDFLAEAAKSKAEKMGSGVSLQSHQKQTNKLGWEGFHARYTFEDINQVNLAVGEMEAGDEAGPSGKTSASADTAYRFEFTPGNPASLKIVPVAEEEEPAEETETETLQAGGMDQMGQDMMMQMMAPMLKGMRLSFYLKVDGEITDTNARFRSEKHPNGLTVMDMRMDNLLSNPEAMKLLSSQDKASRAKLATLDIPGLKLEDPEKTLTVQFK